MTCCIVISKKPARGSGIQRKDKVYGIHYWSHQKINSLDLLMQDAEVTLTAPPNPLSLYRQESNCNNKLNM
jgi:hypothetical protein